MNQIICTGLGGTEKLSWVKGTVAACGPGQVAVRVEFAGVAFADTMARQGMYPQIPPHPYVPGYDFSGVIEALGDGVSGLRVGQRVVGFMASFGSYAQRLIAPANSVVPLPDGVSSDAAVALCLNYLTAYHLLHQLAQVKRGETVVVTSAAGGVGTALLDLGREAGVRLFGTASAGKLDTVRERGAEAIDYRNQDFEAVLRQKVPEGVDVFIDQISADTMAKGYRLVKRGGRYLNNGSLGVRGNSRNAFLPFLARFAFRHTWPDGRKLLFNSGLAQYISKHPNWFREVMPKLLAMANEGKIVPVVGARFALKDAALAHQTLENGGTIGKIVLDCR